MRHRRRPQLAHAGTAVTLALLTVGMAACTSSQAPQAVGPPDRPARVVATQTISPRVRDLTIDSPALGRSAKVRLLLPRRFRPAEPALAGAVAVARLLRHLPELDPLHRRGGAGRTGRRAGGDARSRTGQLLFRLAFAGPGRAIALGDLPPDRAAAVAGARLAGREPPRGRRAVQGLGAMAYAARHPGMFRAAASATAACCTPATVATRSRVLG